jgi:hypothetical protein
MFAECTAESIYFAMFCRGNLYHPFVVPPLGGPSPHAKGPPKNRVPRFAHLPCRILGSPVRSSAFRRSGPHAKGPPKNRVPRFAYLPCRILAITRS